MELRKIESLDVSPAPREVQHSDPFEGEDLQDVVVAAVEKAEDPREQEVAVVALDRDERQNGEACGPFLTSPLAPRGEIFPPGVMFTPLFNPGVNTLYCLEEWRGEQRISPPEDNFTPRGQNSPPGDNIAPGGQSLSLGAKLRMGLWRQF
jgi:hypothetical protein